MQNSLIEEFLDEECSDYVRDLILSWIAENKSRAEGASTTLEFNRFEVFVDLESNSVLVEDVLDDSPGNTTSIEKLRAQLLKARGNTSESTN